MEMSSFNDIVGAAKKIITLTSQAGMSDDEFAKSILFLSSAVLALMDDADKINAITLILDTEKLLREDAKKLKEAMGVGE
jgi:hypothetical protein